MELPDPPDPWRLKSLIEINEGSWSAHYWAPEDYVYGYGSTAAYAVLDAIQRIENGDTFERLSGFPVGGKSFKDLKDLLKLPEKKPQPMLRRL